MVFLRDDQFNIIRESIDNFLVSKKVNYWKYSHLNKIIGLGKSKTKNQASVEHDKYL